MNQEGDVLLFQTNDEGDIESIDGVVTMSGGLETMFYLSIFGGNEDDDATSGNNVDVVSARMGRMFGNAVSYNVSLPTWRDFSGDLWDVNTVVNLLAPGAMVYRLTRLIVRQVKLVRTEGTETALLNCVLPGAFSGKIPEALPWEE